MPTSTHDGAQVIGADPACDGHQPCPGRGIATESVHRPGHTQVDILGEIVGSIMVHQMGTEAPDIDLGRSHEGREGSGIAVTCCQQQMGRVIHGGSGSIVEERGSGRGWDQEVTRVVRTVQTQLFRVHEAWWSPGSDARSRVCGQRTILLSGEPDCGGDGLGGYGHLVAAAATRRRRQSDAGRSPMVAAARWRQQPDGGRSHNHGRQEHQRARDTTTWRSPMNKDCATVRGSASAHLDGELGLVGANEVAAHAAVCEACRAHLAAMATLDRSLRLAPAPAVPDLSDAIVAAVDLDGDLQRGRQRRGVVALTGAVLVALSLPGLLGVTAMHAQREVAMLELAIGLAVVLLAWRPRRVAAGLFPVVATMSVLVVATAVVDVATGLTTPLAELAHLPIVVAAVLCWHWARPAWRTRYGLHVEPM